MLYGKIGSRRCRTGHFNGPVIADSLRFRVPSIETEVWPMPDVPIVISTWPFGLSANEAAWRVLTSGGAALDAVVEGASSCEDDPSVDSVGFGGLPDASGAVTLDASVMDDRGRCGAVACLMRVRYATRAARLVMERTRHVMLVGEAATRFALANGLPESDLLSESAAAKYAEWKRANPAPAAGPLSGHDTIGILAIDAAGRLAGACSTSGVAFKLPGRVGDSPVIGAGLYVEGGVGAAAATGVGEEVAKVCGSYAVVQNLRRGMTPDEAIEDVLRTIARRRGDHHTDVSFVALRADGAAGGLSLRAETKYQYAVITPHRKSLVAPEPLF